MIEFRASHTERTWVLHDQDRARAGALPTGPLPNRVDNEKLIGPRLLRCSRLVVSEISGSRGYQPVFR
jgi:hypothetical protein